MRQMFDDLNANELPDLPGTLVALYPDHPEATNSGRQFANAKVVKITVKVGGSAKGYHVADIEGGDFTPASFAAEVVAAHARGNDLFSGYWNDATDAAVRAALIASGVPNFDFSTRRWRAAWNDVQPTALPGCVAWQWADGAMIGQAWDVSAVADLWPAVDTPWVPAVPAPAPAPAPAPGLVSYTVQRGDNESAIAAAHGMTLGELEAANRGSGHPPGNFSDIWPGDTLQVRG